MSDKKVIGILGGMGPLATADLFQKITLHTAASCDQDHPRVCIDSNTNISDRTAALLHGGADPVPEMVKSAQRLESIGADLLIMPCNTAHNFYDAVASSVSIPVLHMIAITRDALKSRGVKCAGLLATDGTVQTGIYQRTFEGSGVELLTPDNTEDQSAVMDIIYNGVKAGDLTHDATAFRAACEHLLARGAEVLILGCTELPPAFDIYHLDYPNVDPTLELALAAGIVGGGGFEAIIVHRKHGFAAVDVVLVADQLDGGRSVVGGKGAETEGDGKIVLHRLGLEGEGNRAGVGVQVEALDRVVELRGQRGALLHRFAHGAADARDLRGKAGLHAHDL